MDDTAPKRTGRGSRQFHAKPFVGVPKALAADPTISPTAKTLWMAVVLLAWDEKHDPDDREANGASIPDLARYVGVSEPTLRKARAELHERGWLANWKRGQGLADGYEAQLDPPGIDRPGTKDSLGVTPKDSLGARARVSNAVELEGTLEEKQQPAPPAPKRKRARTVYDDAFDAMAEVTDTDPELEGGRIAKALTKLRKHSGYIEVARQQGVVTAEQELARAIRLRAGQYVDHFGPDVHLTPSALVSNWRRVQTSRGRGMGADEIMRMAQQTAERERSET